MPAINIVLLDNFRHDRVVLALDGKRIFDGDDVTTSPLYGYAKVLDPIEVANPQLKLLVELPEKGLTATIPVDLRNGGHLAISVEDAHIIHFVSQRPLGFM